MMHQAFSGPKEPKRAGERAFFPDEPLMPAYGSGFGALKQRYAATDAYLQHHPNIKGWTATTAEHWPIYQTYGDAGMKHFDKSPTYYSQPNTTDVGVPPRLDERCAFKLGWKTMRHEAQIKPYAEREAARHKHEVHEEIQSKQRRELLDKWNTYNGFNPLRHEDLVDRNASDWKPARDTTWIRKEMTGKKRVAPVVHELPATKVEQIQRSHVERVAVLTREGRDRNRNNHTTMKDLLSWGH